MEFGKLSDIEAVDFSLPPDPPGNVHLLDGIAGQKPAARIYLGATGYNMKPWVGTWYTAGTRDKDMLRQYGNQFNTIEHNTTHYRIPDVSTVNRWIDQTPEDFRFCPKVPQIFSHARDLGLSSPLLMEFFERMDQLMPRLGCCFIQLPPGFSPSRTPGLERFLRKWPSHIPLAVEVRHPEFFQGTPAAESYFDLLSGQNVGAVITDVSGRRDVCHMRLTSPFTMIRFVGNGMHPSDLERLRDWSERMADWNHKGVGEFWFFTHEPDNILAPELAQSAAKIFSEQIQGSIVRGPERVPDPPKQGSLF